MPIDNITIQLDMPVPRTALRAREPFEYMGLTFIPKYNSSGDIVQFNATLKNMVIKIQLGLNRCLLQNSIHKFFHGANYTDYPLSEVKQTIEELSDLLHVEVVTGRIKKIECGCNITVPDVTVAWKRLLSYRGKEYNPQVFGDKQYGAACSFDNYEIKAYNKTEQVLKVDKIRIPDNLFRWEIKTTNMSVLHDRKNVIPVYCVRDLMAVENMQYLCADVVEKYHQSIKSNIPDMTNLSLREMTSFARQSHPVVKEKIKAGQIHTYNLDKRTFNLTMKRAVAQADNVGQLIAEKLQLLLHS